MYGSEEAIELGVALNGKEGLVGGGHLRFHQLLVVTLLLLGQTCPKVKWVKIVLGRWIFVLQYRRPAMAVLSRCWNYARKGEDRRRWWPTVREELSMLLLLADAAFPYQQRDDEVGPAASRYSEIWGIHTMEFAEGVVSNFQKDFNEMVDDYRKAKTVGDAKAALLSKDKTRPLQFIPGIHVFEQGLIHVLFLAGVQSDQWQHLSPEDMVRKVAAVNPEAFFANFQPSSVPPCASQQSVDAAFSLSKWFQPVYHFSTNAVQNLADFRIDRLIKTDLPQPSAQAFADKLQKVRGPVFD